MKKLYSMKSIFSKTKCGKSRLSDASHPHSGSVSCCPSDFSIRLPSSRPPDASTINKDHGLHRLLIPAILLLLPVVLILIFDPAAWKSAANLISDILGMIFFIDIPIVMCLWHWFKPEHFHGVRCILLFGLMTLFCWAGIAGGMFIACRTGHTPENGFSIVCAYALGWMYIWFTMIPIGAVYVVFRAILKVTLWIRRRNHAE